MPIGYSEVDICYVCKFKAEYISDFNPEFNVIFRTYKLVNLNVFEIPRQLIMTMQKQNIIARDIFS